MMRKKRRLRRGWLGDVISYAYLTILAVIAAFPLLWILLSSVKSKGELTGNPTAILPKEITFDFFKTVLGQLHFNVNIVNSIIVPIVRRRRSWQGKPKFYTVSKIVDTKICLVSV